MVPDKRSTVRDQDIRQPLVERLRAMHAKSSETEILHELKMPRPSARIDLAVVNGSLAGFEIKSDADSLVRLPRQIAAFSCIFDHVCLVTTERHCDHALSIVPEWWGVWIFRDRGQRRKFSVEVKGRRNPSVDIEAALHLLTRNEMLELLDNSGIDKVPQKLKRDALVRFCLSSLSVRPLMAEVRRVLRRRVSECRS